MKKAFISVLLVLVIVSSVFSFDFGGGVGAGVRFGNKEKFSGGLYETFQISSKSLEIERGIIGVTFFGCYKNFMVGFGLHSFAENTNKDYNEEIADVGCISLGYNFDFHTLVTPSIFIEYSMDNTISVSIVAMFTPHFHKYEVIDYKRSDCNSIGHKTLKCTECGHIKKQTISKEHNFYWEPSSVWIDYYTERCADCGKYSGRVKDHGKIYQL